MVRRANGDIDFDCDVLLEITNCAFLFVSYCVTYPFLRRPQHGKIKMKERGGNEGNDDKHIR